MKISTKLLLIGGVISLGLGVFTTSCLGACDTFGANFADCGVDDIKGIAGTDSVGTAGTDDLITTIKNFINRVLGILALITLVILLRGGFQMVTAAGDDGKYKNGFKILKQAGFGLAFIGLSRLVVSMIFRLIDLIT